MSFETEREMTPRDAAPRAARRVSATQIALALDTLGKRFRAVRYAKGLQTTKIAKCLKVSRQTLSNIESDRFGTDADHIEAFAKLARVRVNWLRDNDGPPPRLDWSKALEKIGSPPVIGTPRRVAAPPVAPTAPPASMQNHGLPIPEIKARLVDHAKRLDLQAQATWQIPREVMTLGFNCYPDSGVIKRALRDLELPGIRIKRGDYELIDGGRERVDEPGLYYVVDPEGLEARRLFVALENNQLTGKLLSSSDSASQDISLDNIKVLGRVMAVFCAI